MRTEDVKLCLLRSGIVMVKAEYSERNVSVIMCSGLNHMKKVTQGNFT